MNRSSIERKRRLESRTALLAAVILAYGVSASAQLPGLPPAPPTNLGGALCELLGLGCPQQSLSFYVVTCPNEPICSCSVGDHAVGGGGLCFNDAALQSSFPHCSSGNDDCVEADGWATSCTGGVDSMGGTFAHCLAVVEGRGDADGSGGAGGAGGSGGGCEDTDGDGDLDCPGDGDDDLECPDEDEDGMEICDGTCSQASQCADMMVTTCCCSSPGESEGLCMHPSDCATQGLTCAP